MVLSTKEFNDFVDALRQHNDKASLFWDLLDYEGVNTFTIYKIGGGKIRNYDFVITKSE